MNAVDLLSRLGSHNIRLWAENDQLRYSAPKGGITDDLLAEIRKNKDELLNLVKNTVRFRRAASLFPVERTDTLRLSFAQERLWFLYHLFPEIPVYNVPLIMRLAGVMDIPALQKSLQALIDRPESLRTCFPTIDDQPVQVIRAALSPGGYSKRLKSNPTMIMRIRPSPMCNGRYIFNKL